MNTAANKAAKAELEDLYDRTAANTVEGLVGGKLPESQQKTWPTSPTTYPNSYLVNPTTGQVIPAWCWQVDGTPKVLPYIARKH